MYVLFDQNYYSMDWNTYVIYVMNWTIGQQNDGYDNIMLNVVYSTVN